MLPFSRLNDIERDRRNPTPDHLIQQFAKVLRIDANYLHYLAGKFPDDIRRMNLSAEEMKVGFTAFRKSKWAMSTGGIANSLN